jgi:hypothetical protein
MKWRKQAGEISLAPPGKRPTTKDEDEDEDGKGGLILLRHPLRNFREEVQELQEFRITKKNSDLEPTSWRSDSIL